MYKLLSYDMPFEMNVIPDGDLIAVDTETTGLNAYKGDKAFLFSFANEEGDISVVERTPENADMLREFFADKSITKIFHNMKFDMKMCREAGYPVRGKVHDTLIMSRLVNENEFSHRLKWLCQVHFDYKALEDELLDEWKKKNEWESYMDIPKDILYPYAAVDAWNCMQLYYLFKEPIALMKRAYRLDLNNTRYSMQMEDIGQLIDKKKAKEIARDMKAEAKVLQQKVKKMNGGIIIEPCDTRTLGFTLFAAGETVKKYTVDKKTKKETMNPSFDEDSLELYTEVPWIPTFIEFKKKRALEKTLRDQLIANLDDKKVLHTNINISLARTRRSSSSGPNLQNIEKKSRIREAFICRKGYTLFYFDYSQIEYRIFAHESRDKALIEGYRSGKLDAHDLTAQRLGVDRDLEAKLINFLILYGGAANALSEKLDRTKAECMSLLEKFHQSYPGLRDLEERLCFENSKKGYIEDQFGMHYHVLPEDEFKIVNTKFQGCAGSVLKYAKLQVRKLLRNTSSNLIGEIHDELIFEISDNDLPFLPPLIKNTMEVMPEGYFSVPLVVDVEFSRTHWGAKEKYTIEMQKEGALPW